MRAAMMRFSLVPADRALPTLHVGRERRVLGRNPFTRCESRGLSREVVAVEEAGDTLKVLLLKPKHLPAVRRGGSEWEILRPAPAGPPAEALLSHGDALALRADTLPPSFLYTVDDASAGGVGGDAGDAEGGAAHAAAAAVVDSSRAAAPSAAGEGFGSGTAAAARGSARREDGDKGERRQRPASQQDNALAAQPPAPKRARTDGPPPIAPLFRKGGCGGCGGGGAGVGASPGFDRVLRWKDFRIRLPHGWFACAAAGGGGGGGGDHELVVHGVDPDPAKQRGSAVVAGFDFDDCLVKGGGRFLSTDAAPRFGNVHAELRRLEASGAKVVIFTNESTERLVKEEAAQRAIEKKIKRLEGFLRECGAPGLEVVMSIRGNSKSPTAFRKPNSGMWRFHAERCNAGVAVDAKRSFYVGDAAGRPTDHGDSDRGFASRAGVAFHTETEYFRGVAP